MHIRFTVLIIFSIKKKMNLDTRLTVVKLFHKNEEHSTAAF